MIQFCPVIPASPRTSDHSPSLTWAYALDNRYSPSESSPLGFERYVQPCHTGTSSVSDHSPNPTSSMLPFSDLQGQGTPDIHTLSHTAPPISRSSSSGTTWGSDQFAAGSSLSDYPSNSAGFTSPSSSYNLQSQGITATHTLLPAPSSMSRSSSSGTTPWSSDQFAIGSLLSDYSSNSARLTSPSPSYSIQSQGITATHTPLPNVSPSPASRSSSWGTTPSGGYRIHADHINAPSRSPYPTAHSAVQPPADSQSPDSFYLPLLSAQNHQGQQMRYPPTNYGTPLAAPDISQHLGQYGNSQYTTSNDVPTWVPDESFAYRPGPSGARTLPGQGEVTHRYASFFIPQNTF